MRLFLRTLAVTGALLVLLLVGVTIAVWAIDVNDFRAPIQSYVKDKTGRDLVIRGSIDLKLSLVPTLVLNDVTLSNASWAKTPQMLAAKRVEADLALIPLLRRRFEVGHFTLVEPVVTLETDRAGRGNWEFGSASEGGAKPGASARATAIDGLQVADLSVSQGQVNYVDGKSGKVTRIVIDRLALHAKDVGSPIAAEFRGRIDEVAVALEGELGPFDALRLRQWPYPVTMKGDVDGRKTSISTKLALADGAATLTDLDLMLGPSHVTGQASISTGSSPKKITFKLASEALSLDALARPTAVAAPATVKTPAAVGPVFKPTPVDFSPLRTIDAQGEISVGQLVLDAGYTLSHVRLNLALAQGRLHAELADAGAMGGSIRGRIDADASRTPPSLSVKLDGKALDLSAVLAAAGVKRETRNGKIDVSLDIAASGDSPRAWASTATGQVLAQVGKATLINTGNKGDGELDRLGQAINPFREVRASNELDCAVVRLPLRNGVAAVDQSIALETHEVSVSASGSVDLRNESLDLSIEPRIKRGIPVDVAQFAELVHFRGPFRDPKLSIDRMGTIVTAARIGAAIQTGGLSVLGEALLSKGAAGADGGVCRIALQGSGSAKATPVAGSKPAARNESPLEAIGRALGRIR